MPKKRKIAHRETIPVTTYEEDGSVVKSSFVREFTAEEWKHEQKVRKAMREIYCLCSDGGLNPKLYNDGECSCGIHKHHWHCGRCGKITQIG